MVPVKGGGGGWVGLGVGGVVGLRVGRAVGRRVAVGVAEGGGVSVLVGMAVWVGVSLGTGVLLGRGVAVGGSVGTGVEEGVRVRVAVAVGVKVGFGVRVGVAVVRACCLGPRSESEQAMTSKLATMATKTIKRFFISPPVIPAPHCQRRMVMISTPQCRIRSGDLGHSLHANAPTATIAAVY